MILSRFRRISWMTTRYDPWDSRFPWFFMILQGFSWFWVDFHTFLMILQGFSCFWVDFACWFLDMTCLRAEMTRFPSFPGYVLAETLKWLDSWIWADLMPLKTRFWWFWTPDTGFYCFWKLSDACFEMIFLLSGWFWDDFSSWLPRFALTTRIYWPFPYFRMILRWFLWILSFFLCLGPFWWCFS